MRTPNAIGCIGRQRKKKHCHLRSHSKGFFAISHYGGVVVPSDCCQMRTTFREWFRNGRISLSLREKIRRNNRCQMNYRGDELEVFLGKPLFTNEETTPFFPPTQATDLPDGSLPQWIAPAQHTSKIHRKVSHFGKKPTSHGVARNPLHTVNESVLSNRE